MGPEFELSVIHSLSEKNFVNNLYPKLVFFPYCKKINLRYFKMNSSFTSTQNMSFDKKSLNAG